MLREQWDADRCWLLGGGTEREKELVQMWLRIPDPAAVIACAERA